MKICSPILLKFNKSMNYYEKQYSRNQYNGKSNSLIRNFLLDSPRFRITRQLPIWCDHRRPELSSSTVVNPNGTPKGCISGNQRSFYLQYLDQNLWAILFKLIFEIRFSDASLATDVGILLLFFSQKKERQSDLSVLHMAQRLKPLNNEFWNYVFEDSILMICIFFNGIRSNFPRLCSQYYEQ